MLSRYLKVRERDGYVAVFHELHPDPIYCLTGEWRAFTEDQSSFLDILASLTKRNLVVQSRADDDLEFEAVEAELLKKLNQPNILYLMMASGCNFGCSYCPIPKLAKQHGDVLLSQEDAFAGIELWREHVVEAYDPKEEYCVIFYGGEPLLNKQVIKLSLEKISAMKSAGQLPSNVSLMIATNGVLMDEATISLCLKYGVMVAVGLDGPKELNDALRVDDSGNGTFDRVVAVIRTLVKSGVQTFVSASITPNNIGMIAEYTAFLKELGVSQFGFNFLKGRALSDLIPDGMISEYYLKAARGVIANFDPKNPDAEYQMEKKLGAFVKKDFFPVDCTCYGNQLVIQPDGQVSNCPFYRAGLGCVRELGHDFRIWKQPIVSEWRKRLPLYSESFRENDAKSICGPGCAWSCIEHTGNVLAVDDSSRTFSEEVFNELIWSNFRK